MAGRLAASPASEVNDGRAVPRREAARVPPVWRHFAGMGAVPALPPRVLKRAGLERIRFHDLRHTAATILLGRGVHPKIVSEMLGHTSIAITLELYSHVIPTMQRDAAATFDAVIGAKA